MSAGVTQLANSVAFASSLGILTCNRLWSILRYDCDKKVNFVHVTKTTLLVHSLL